MSARKTLATLFSHLLIIFTVVGASLTLTRPVKAQQPESEADFKKTLPAKINAWTQNRSCGHNLHVIFYLDTTYDCLDSISGHVFLESVWPSLLQNYFVPGDKFDLVFFGNRCVEAVPLTQALNADNLNSINDWFGKLTKFDDHKEQDKGTLVQMAQWNALQRGLAVTQNEDVLILVISNMPKGDGGNAQMHAEDDYHDRKNPEAIRRFTGNSSVSSSPETVKLFFKQNDAAPSNLYIWHYFRKADDKVAATNPARAREIFVPGSDAPPPADRRGMIAALGAAIFFIFLSPLSTMKSKVKVTVAGIPKDITVDAWKTIPVRVSAPTGETEAVDLQVANMSGGTMPVGEIDLRSYGTGGIWTRLEGHLAEGNTEDARLQQLTEVVLPYGESTHLQVWLDERAPEAACLVSVQPFPWVEGKTMQILSALAGLGIAIILWVIAARPLPIPPSSSTQTVESVCSNGSSLTQ